jgi:hypothetical protein
MRSIREGDCVIVPDGRIGRVREKAGDSYRVRLRRKTSNTHQFMTFRTGQLTLVECPKGWMTPEGYLRYLRTTLAKMRARQAKQRRSKNS